MLPILFSIGSLHLFSLGVFLVLAWGVFSFLFWKSLRAQAVSDEHIFDLTFYATLFMVVGARASFVFLDSASFISDPLRIVAIWVAPGLSFWGGLIVALAALFIAAKRYKLRLGMILDGLAASLPLSLAVGLIGGLLDGASAGVSSSLPWAVHYVGEVGARHPIQLYEMIALLCIMLILKLLAPRAKKDHWPFGHMGLIFFLAFSFAMFLLEFLKESGIYFFHLHPNQWVQIAFFAESAGALYVRGGGKYTIRHGVSSIVMFVRQKGAGIYGKLIHRQP